MRKPKFFLKGGKQGRRRKYRTRTKILWLPVQHSSPALLQTHFEKQNSKPWYLLSRAQTVTPCVCDETEKGKELCRRQSEDASSLLREAAEGGKMSDKDQQLFEDHVPFQYGSKSLGQTALTPRLSCPPSIPSTVSTARKSSSPYWDSNSSPNATSVM